MRLTAFLNSVPFLSYRSFSNSSRCFTRGFVTSIYAHSKNNPQALSELKQSQGRQPKRSLTSMSSSKSNVPTIEQLQTVKFPMSAEYASEILNEYGISRLDLISTLMSTSDGARGLFVTLLTSPSEHMLEDASFILTILKAGDKDHAKHIRELMVKNVVMPTAMVIQYTSQGETEQAQSSEQTKNRAFMLLKSSIQIEKHHDFNGLLIQHVANDMIKAIVESDGPFAAFIKKWGYNEEQKTAMKFILHQALE